MPRPGGLDLPLYEYRCRACEERFEVYQRIGADSRGLECPACGQVDELEKEYSTFASAGGGACGPSGGGFT
jgi:putative FmdB family regulatory protein